MAILNRLPKFAITLLGAILIGAIGVLDYLTGTELSFSIFYLVPVVMVTWLINRRAGVGYALASAITWLIADLGGGNRYSHPLIPYWNSGVRLGFFLVVTLILSELKYRLELEEHQARTDFLTGAHNLRSYLERIEAEIDRMRRYQHIFSIAYVDIDHFKSINDQYGHATGDRLLKMTTETMRNTIRSSDVIARLGGDEFAILLIESDSNQAERAGQRIHSQLTAMAQAQRWPVSFSIGMVTFLTPPATAESALKAADSAMYSVKNSGKNRFSHIFWEGAGPPEVERASQSV